MAGDPEREPGVRGVLWVRAPRRLVAGDPEPQRGDPGSPGGPGVPPPRGRGRRTSTGGSGESWRSGRPVASWPGTPSLTWGSLLFPDWGRPRRRAGVYRRETLDREPGVWGGPGHPVCPRAWISRWAGGGGGRAEPSPCSCFSSGTSNRNLWGPGSPQPVHELGGSAHVAARSVWGGFQFCRRPAYPTRDSASAHSNIYSPPKCSFANRRPEGQGHGGPSPVCKQRTPQCPPSQRLRAT